MKRSSKKKAWTKMTARELAEATKEFDKPIRFEDTRPLTPAERLRWRRARRGSVDSLRLSNGKHRTIRVRVDEDLLKQFDKFAKRNHMTRDELISRSLRSAIAFVD
jgi:uncharacterized protein (DUF4415 family)